MDKLAEWLTRYVLVQGVIEEEDYAIYKYGFQTGVELLLCVVTSIAVAIYMGKGCECFLLMVSFFSLRSSMDGIHMKHFSSCYLFLPSQYHKWIIHTFLLKLSIPTLTLRYPKL